jgi:hypothetical protein
MNKKTKNDTNSRHQGFVYGTKNAGCVLNRRTILKWSLLVGLSALPIGIAVFRTKHKPWFSVDIECLLTEYRSFKGNDLLKLIDSPNLGLIDIQALKTIRDEINDNVDFTIRFDKNLPVESQVNIGVCFYSANGELIGKKSTIIRHPAYVPPEWASVPYYYMRGGSNVQVVHVNLFPNKRISDVVKMSLFVNRHEI